MIVLKQIDRFFFCFVFCCFFVFILVWGGGGLEVGGGGCEGWGWFGVFLLVPLLLVGDVIW